MAIGPRASATPGMIKFFQPERPIIGSQPSLTPNSSIMSSATRKLGTLTPTVAIKATVPLIQGFLEKAATNPREMPTNMAMQKETAPSDAV